MKNITKSTNRGHSATVFLFVAAAIMLLSIPSCTKRTGNTEQLSTVDSSDVYTLEVLKDRKTKDLHFVQSENSPLKATDKELFAGLNYYPVSKSFTFATVLQRRTPPEEIVMATSKDRPRAMFSIGYFSFFFARKEYRLQAFAPKDTSDGMYWFIPFTDATSGNETYGGGRYIDIDDTRSDSTFLDFNYAYNPYCAYNDGYDCPIPPVENHLPIAIKAGEKQLFSNH